MHCALNPLSNDKIDLLMYRSPTVKMGINNFGKSGNIIEKKDQLYYMDL